MPAMHAHVLEAMTNELEHKRDILLRTLHFDMTHEECIRLVAPKEHVEILTRASEFANINASENWMALTVPATVDGEYMPKVMLMMRTHAQQTPPLMPRNPLWQPDQAGFKVIEWITRRLEIGRRFGVAKYVLHVLNQMCSSGAQLRYMWPAALHLCRAGVNDRTDVWMERNTAYKPQRFMPAVSPELKKLIQDSSALLTSVALLGEDVSTPTAGPVLITEYAMPYVAITDQIFVSRL